MVETNCGRRERVVIHMRAVNFAPRRATKDMRIRIRRTDRIKTLARGDVLCAPEKKHDLRGCPEDARRWRPAPAGSGGPLELLRLHWRSHRRGKLEIEREVGRATCNQNRGLWGHTRTPASARCEPGDRTMKSKLIFLLGFVTATSVGVAQTSTSTQTTSPAPRLPNFAPPPVSFAPSRATPSPAPQSTSPTNAGAATTGPAMAAGSTTIAAPISGVVVSRPPPPQPATSIMPSAVPNQTWVPGHYVWRNNDWVWINGSWTTPPQTSAVWISGSYDPETRMWVEGHWSTPAATGTSSATGTTTAP
jgi:hypothetical protein